MELKELIDKWYKKFEAMKAGDTIEIAVIGKRDPKLFTDICKSFIDNGNDYYDFTDDYKFFRRRMSWPELNENTKFSNPKNNTSMNKIK